MLWMENVMATGYIEKIIQARRNQRKIIEKGCLMVTFRSEGTRLYLEITPAKEG